MFKKPFKIKSNTQIKSSEMKTMKSQFMLAFPSLTAHDLDNIIPKKETAFCMKIVCSDESIVQVYLIQKRAIAFEFQGVLFPTVYFLWKCPEAALTFTTTSFVVSKIKAGADLMLPGVILQPTYNDFLKKSIAGVNSTQNKAAIAVGITGMSYGEMLKSQGKGKCVIIYHYYGDKLCSAEDLPNLLLPELGPPDWLKQPPEEVDVSEDMQSTKPEEDIIAIEDVCGDFQETDGKENVIPEEMTEKEMDDLMQHCFLAAIKYSKTLAIPVLTSSFYKLEMIPACPPGQYLDVKKSSYKKLGQFLKQQMKDGIVTVKEKKKGAEHITSVNIEHPSVVNFYLKSDSRPKKLNESKDEANATNIVEEYVITPIVAPLFAGSGLLKGDMLQATTIRKHITEYVKKNNCQDESNKRLVKIEDPHLAALCKNADIVTWEQLMETVCKSMKSCYKVTSGEEEKISKGKIQPIGIKVETRSGNKKVTLVNNLELFGIRLSEFAKECQHGVATSTSINKCPGKKSDQLLIQGNQVLFIYNQLTEKYKIPKKYINGLEYAPKLKSKMFK